MEKEFNTNATDGIEEEICETLIAISVLAKRLAKKLAENVEPEGEQECKENTD